MPSVAPWSRNKLAKSMPSKNNELDYFRTLREMEQ